MKRLLLSIIASLTLASLARADMVTERWGVVAGPVQHAGTVRHEAAGDKGTLLHFDLKALPKDATVYRARLVLMPERGEPYGLSGHMHHGAAMGIHVDYRMGFEVVTVTADDKDAAKPLPTQAPLHRWFDATDVVRGWAKTMPKAPALLVRQARPWKKDATFLEITYEGKLAEPPEPVSEVKALCRKGQVFITWKEIEDISEGVERCTWGQLMKRLSNFSPDGPIPKDDKREVRYRIYRSGKPIARDTIGQAQLVAEVMPGSGFNTRIYNRLWQGENTLWKLDDAFIAQRLAIEPGKPLAPGVGLCVRTVAQDGPAYYAVVTTIDGRENTRDLITATVAGPVEEKVAEPEPVLQEEMTTKGQHGPTVRRRYVYWAEPPLAPRPLQYGLIVQHHPDKVSKPAPLEVTRGTGQSIEPYLDRVQRADAVVMAVSDDPEGTFWQGGNTCRGSLLSYAQGKWEPFPARRQANLVAWALKTLPVDEQQVYVYGGIWGLWELRQPKTYSAFIHWGMGEPTKGFLSYNRCLGVWGPPDVYKGRPDSENPYAMYDYAKFVAEDPARKLPFQMHQPCGGTHTTELGWPAVPRFQRALLDAHQPFVATIGKKDSAPAPAVLREFQAGRLPIRRDQSKPAFANCTLDDNPGNGDIQSGDANGFLNGHLLWEPGSVADEKTHWEMTVFLDKTAPLEQCRVDLTPRDCQQFLLKPGTPVKWTNGAGQSGAATADKHGLVTLKGVQVGKGKNRVRVETTR